MLESVKVGNGQVLVVGSDRQKSIGKEVTGNLEATGKTNGKDQHMSEIDTTTDTLDQGANCCVCSGKELPEDTDSDAGEGYRETKHKQVHIAGYGLEADVDEGIAQLIKELWRCGIWTRMSCQEGLYGYVWLNFFNSFEADRFLNIVAEGDPKPGSLYRRILNLDEEHDNWIIQSSVYDYGPAEESLEDDLGSQGHGPSHIGVSISVWFPSSDLPTVMRKLAAQPTYEETKDDLEDDAALRMALHCC
jgi:hypothetical protein